MFDRLESVAQKFRKLEEDLSNPELLANQREYQKVAREHAEIAPIVEAYGRYRNLNRQVLDNQQLFEQESDSEMRELYRQEIAELKRQIGSFETTTKDHPLRREFSRLHGVSAVCNLVVFGGGVALVVLL